MSTLTNINVRDNIFMDKALLSIRPIVRGQLVKDPHSIVWSHFAYLLI